MGANVVNYFPDPLEQLRVIKSWFAYLNAVAAKLPRIANQTRSMSKGPRAPDHHWPPFRRTLPQSQVQSWRRGRPRAWRQLRRLGHPR